RPRRATAFLPSPLFLLVVACFAASGTLAWTSGFGTGRGARLAVFVFVASGWLVSLCLHEFGHAFTAWRFGDRDVAVRGYLTLNPAKYANAALSIVLPMIFLLFGGIGLPGGAVYINRGAIWGKWRHSLVSGIGPLVNLALALALIAVLSSNGTGATPPLGFAPTPYVSLVLHQDFWTALSFLAFLQVTAAIFNLLPVPGLDGYGIWAPWLPRQYAAATAKVGPVGYLIVMGLLWIPQVNRAFFDGILHLTGALGVQGYYIALGQYLFQFWSH
ncbi:MAG: site-2 protease family protein, partial [Trebonia sp.]